MTLVLLTNILGADTNWLKVTLVWLTNIWYPDTNRLAVTPVPLSV